LANLNQQKRFFALDNAKGHFVCGPGVADLPAWNLKADFTFLKEALIFGKSSGAEL
jgi:hypothetical protein